MVIDTKNGIAFAQLCATIGAVKLEAKGMKHSSGRSMTATAKARYGIKGNRSKVLAQLEALKEQALWKDVVTAAGYPEDK